MFLLLGHNIGKDWGWGKTPKQQKELNKELENEKAAYIYMQKATFKYRKITNLSE